MKLINILNNINNNQGNYNFISLVEYNKTNKNYKINKVILDKINVELLKALKLNEYYDYEIIKLEIIKNKDIILESLIFDIIKTKEILDKNKINYNLKDIKDNINTNVIYDGDKLNLIINITKIK